MINRSPNNRESEVFRGNGTDVIMAEFVSQEIVLALLKCANTVSSRNSVEGDEQAYWTMFDTQKGLVVRIDPLELLIEVLD